MGLVMDFEGSFSSKSKKSRLLTLQLAPMIDVFTLIIVFLLKGAVFTTNNVEVPNDINPPTSISKETAEVAPQVYISLKQVRFPMINKTISKQNFLEDDGLRQNIREELKKYYSKMDIVAKQAAINLNIVADVGVKYSYLFEVVKVAREAGYNSMLFVALGEQTQ